MTLGLPRFGRLLVAIVLPLLVLAAGAPAAAQPRLEPRRPPVIPEAGQTPAPPGQLNPEWLIDQGIYRLEGLDADLPLTDLLPLKRMLEGAQVVGLGESVHTSGGYYRMKHRLFRYLVEELGYRAFAMETPWPYAETTAQYVATCEGTVNEAMGWLFGVWASEETGGLLTYMCTWNQSHPDDPITFFGFDVQQSEVDGPALIDYLRGRGVSSDDPRITGIRRCDGVVAFAFPSDADNEACLTALDAVDALLRELDPSDQVQLDRADVEWAKIRSIGVRAWQGLAYWYYRGDDVRSTNARDPAMATVFQRIRKLKVGVAKTAVWAHNVHIAKGPTQRSSGYTYMGDLLHQDMGGKYAAVALAAAHPSIDWPFYYCGPFSIYPQSAEWQLHALGEEFLLVDLDFNGTTRRDPALFDPWRPTIIGYNAFVPAVDFDAMVYLHFSEKMTPVYWPPCTP